MATCPAGHTSVSPDYCDVCGEIIGAPAPAPAPLAAASAGPAPSGEPCPDCGTPAADRFCEECGYDFATGGGGPVPVMEPAPVPAPEPAPVPDPQPEAGAGIAVAEDEGTGGWVAVVVADREYYDTVIAELEPDAGVIAFPPYAPERHVPLQGAQIRIGRAHSRGEPPEIDLRTAPEDPGVSHLHAVLLSRAGGWVLVDPGSRNGTCLNGSSTPVGLNEEVPVGEGDRIHVGVWTTITLERDGG